MRKGSFTQANGSFCAVHWHVLFLKYFEYLQKNTFNPLLKLKLLSTLNDTTADRFASFAVDLKAFRCKKSMLSIQWLFSLNKISSCGRPLQSLCERSKNTCTARPLKAKSHRVGFCIICGLLLWGEAYNLMSIFAMAPWSWIDGAQAAHGGSSTTWQGDITRYLVGWPAVA